ncbi:hypothetical protein [uncultured Kordia sp.]|uniref:hypothetical protein n=1 Tax=uncultured Kordia sp. TaxID=507699 RepID=UPI00261B39AC|nr:hypothetical protein [uncultured Kordia sp.]
MKKQGMKNKLNLKRNVISNFESNEVTGKGPETWTCDCWTRRKDCKTYEPTQDGCQSFWCSGIGCS